MNKKPHPIILQHSFQQIAGVVVFAWVNIDICQKEPWFFKVLCISEAPGRFHNPFQLVPRFRYLLEDHVSCRDTQDSADMFPLHEEMAKEGIDQTVVKNIRYGLILDYRCSWMMASILKMYFNVKRTYFSSEVIWRKSFSAISASCLFFFARRT